MTIQRQYSLPNCQLIVEGVGPEPKTPDAMIRPTLATVTHVECHFLGHEKPLVGGRDLLEHLVSTISEYAQEFLSGVAHPDAHTTQRGKPRLVQLERVDTNLHRLLVQPIINNPQAADKQAIDSQTVYSQLDLTTVQLFDLVEAIDQLIADSQTLPDLGVKLHPLAKRYAAAQEPVAKRALPLVLGTSGLAVAAAALFYLPIPQVRRPDAANAQTPTQEAPVALRSPAAPGAEPASSPTSSPASSSDNSSSDSLTGSASNSSTNATTSPTASPSAASTSSSASPVASTEPEGRQVNNTTSTSIATTDTSGRSTASPPASGTASPATTTGKPPSSEEIEALLNSAPEITDPAKLDQVLGEFRTNLYQAWDQKAKPTFNQDLVYRVGVNEQGEVVGYRFVDRNSLNFVNEIPLQDMLRDRTTLQNVNQDPIAQFRVVFKSNGVAEISPWHGWEESERSPASPTPAN